MNIYDYAEHKGISIRQVSDFTSGVNPLGPSNKAKHAIRKSVKLLEFPPDKKIRYLKRYICRQEMIGEDCILFGQGSSSLINNLLVAIKPNDVLLVSPVSKRYTDILHHYRMNVHLLHSEEKTHFEFKIDIESAIERLKNIDMLILPNPHDVTGTMLNADNIAILSDVIEKTGKILVIDESYIEFTSQKSSIKQAVNAKNTVLIRTFSLFYTLLGMKIGYMAGSPEFLKRLSYNMSYEHINTPACAAAIASLKDKGFRKKSLKFIEEEKIYVINKLKGINGLMIKDTSSNFILIKIDAEMSGLENLFIRHNIIADTYKSESGGIFLRMPIKKHKQNAQFIKTLKYILKANPH